MRLPNKIYDIMKWAAIIAMPALSTFVTVVFKIWGFQYGPEISQTITAVATLMGALLCVSNINYKGDEEEEEE